MKAIIFDKPDLLDLYDGNIYGHASRTLHVPRSLMESLEIQVHDFMIIVERLPTWIDKGFFGSFKSIRIVEEIDIISEEGDCAVHLRFIDMDGEDYLIDV